MSSSGYGIGWMTPSDPSGEFNRTSFIISQQLAKLRTMVPVKVMAVLPQSGSGQATQGAVAGAGYVQVQPMISMVDGGGNTTPHGTIYNIPYTRVYGGINAVICDPSVGDIGYMVVADRDISSWKTQVVGNQTQGGAAASSPTAQGSGAITPGSNRRFNLADGIYIGGVLNATPKQYVTFQTTGITINDKNSNQIVMNQSGITITDDNGNTIVMENGDVNITAKNIYLTGTVYLGGKNSSNPVAMQGTVDTGGYADVSNLATKAFVS
jgi:hypothetical protein